MEEKQLKLQTITELKEKKIHGRIGTVTLPLTLFWTGSALELNCRASELWIEVEADYELYEPWISIQINLEKVSRMMLPKGRQWICVFRGMNKDIVKNVRIVKETQAMSGDPRCCLKLHQVKTDGSFESVEEKPYKLEFIGDSITSGEGAVGAKQEEDWIPMWFSAIDNYTAMTAKRVNADYRVISQSGWGVLTSWDNNPKGNIPDIYDKVCGLLSGEENINLGALEEHDFTSWQPDVVVINLGTNDAGAFTSPEWRDETTGEHHKQRLNEDGSFHEEDLQAFEAAIVRFLAKLRHHNPGAQLVWAYGMIGIVLMPAIYRAVDTYQRDTGDKRVTVFQLPNTTEDTVGARNHPGYPAHRKTAEELGDFLKQFLE